MNARGHFLVGAATGIALSLTKQLIQKELYPAREFDFGECATYALVGGGMALVPDLLEPSLRNPNHRQFCHSVVFGGLVLYACCGKHTHSLPVAARDLLAVGAMAYCSHLSVDALTPRSIRFC
ncbi:MAG: metal-dependent hydrolase [Cephaloticoccus sp.]|nr:metal-dependent hydrolase [Cephaloticoccus sp.]